MYSKEEAVELKLGLEGRLSEGETRKVLRRAKQAVAEAMRAGYAEEAGARELSEGEGALLTSMVVGVYRGEELSSGEWVELMRLVMKLEEVTRG